jgi:hypothetical protein
MRRYLAAILVVSLLTPAALGQVTNLRVVTDASPDYHDMDGLVHSVTSNWDTPKDQTWAMFYWMHKARRQTSPMQFHGYDLADPIMQFNDFGYMMCSTISGTKVGIWHHMGLPGQYWDVTLHSVPQVFYDGRWHMYDNSMSIIYTLCDGETIAGIEDIGASLGCDASGGKEEPGHIAMYHALNGTSVNGFIEGADTQRPLKYQGIQVFNPNGLKHRTYYNHWMWGHRYVLNLRPGEVYTRHYSRLDQPQNEGDPFSDPRYFVPRSYDERRRDLEEVNPRYCIRGNGVRTFAPTLTEAELPQVLHNHENVQAIAPAGLVPTRAGQPGHAVFKVEGSNVITSMTIDAQVRRRTEQDQIAVSISTSNGVTWDEVWRSDETGEHQARIELLEPVNGTHDVLVKVELLGQEAADYAVLSQIAFETITQINSKTQPQLNIGRNTIYVGTGDPTGTIVLFPDLSHDRYKSFMHDEQNVATSEEPNGYQAVMYAAEAGQEAHIVFRMDAPGDLKTVTYGARMYNRAPNAEIELLHSFDGGENWNSAYRLTDTSQPWDVIEYITVDEVPAGTNSVLFKYRWNGQTAGASSVGLYAVRMEGSYDVPDAGFKPVEVTFDWSERQEDYSLVERSHTQLVEQVPFTYEINVDGADHPVVNTLTVSLQGAREDVTYGYSDGNDVGGEKWVGNWVTHGTNFAEGRPYTSTVPSATNWDAGDPDGTILTDGVVGPPYSGGTSYASGALYPKGSEPEITIDLGEMRRFSAFRIQISGYPGADAIRGQVKDQVEVLTSTDGEQFTSQGLFDFRLRWKDLPVNFMWPDSHHLTAHNHTKLLDEPVQTRYVMFKLTSDRFLSVSELQVIESVTSEPFDLRLALPADAAE